MKRYILGAAAMAGALVMSASSVDFSYAPDGSTPYSYGTNLADTYDVALHLDGALLAGTTVTGFTLQMNTLDDLSDFSGWLTTSLSLNDDKSNLADIETGDVTFDGNTLVYVPSVPYTVTADGVYVGFSFKVNSVTEDAAKAPLLVSIASDDPEGFYIHTKRTFRKWADAGIGAVLYATVHLEGDFHADAALISAEDFYGKKGAESPVTVTLTNMGTNPIGSISYSYDIQPAGLHGTRTVELEQPVSPQYCSKSTVSIPLEIPDTYDPQQVTIGVTEVNGRPNGCADAATTTAGLECLPFVPVHRPLMEEYTGTWCGFCPRGFIALEYMAERHPDIFVGVSYHNGDVMECVTQFPSDVSGLPMGYVDRIGAVDPYYGAGNAEFGIEDYYLAVARQFTPADISVSIDYADDTCETLRLTSGTSFVYDMEDTDYRISYLLVSDGLKAPSADKEGVWSQSNNYSGSSYTGNGWDVFSQGGAKVTGLTYNDVLVYADDYLGEAGSVPAAIVRGETYAHSYEIPLDKVRNVDNEPLIQDLGNVYAVAVLTDARSGKVINCNRSNYLGESGVGSISADTGRHAVSAEYFDLSGRRLDSAPAKGMAIKVTRYDDGTVRSSKILR